jgi:hypothetical protein
MHALFHIKPSGRYRSLGMITVLIWKTVCINLYITYFNTELKRTHTNMSDWYRLRDDNSPDMEKGIVLFIKRLDIMCPDICPWADTVSLWHFRYLRMGNVITYKYVKIVLPACHFHCKTHCVHWRPSGSLTRRRFIPTPPGFGYL